MARCRCWRWSRKLPEPPPPPPAAAAADPPFKSLDDPALVREPSSDPSQASVPTSSATAKAGWEGTGAGGATPLSASSSKRRAMSPILQVLRFSTQSTSSSQMNTRSSPPPPEPISSSPPPASPQCIPPDSPQYNTSDHNHQRQALPPPSFSRIAFNGNGAPASHVNALEGSLATKSLTRGHINEANGENGLNVSLHHPLLSLSDSFAAETYSPPGDERPVAGQSISNGFHGQESTNEKAKASRNSKQRSEAQKYNKSSASYPSSYYCQHAETVVLRTDFSTNGISHRRLEFMPMSLVQSPPPHHPLSIGGPIKARKGMRVILTKEGSKAFDEQ